MSEHHLGTINLEDDAVYKVVDGQIVKIDSPESGFGEQIITWQDGKPTHYKVIYTKK